MAVPPWLRHPWMHGLLLCAVTAAAYVGVVHAGFVFDDFALVVYNGALEPLSQAWRFFAQDLWATADGGYASGYYRPLMTLSLAVDRQLFGLEPGGYHLHSLAWHLAAVWALHRLLLRLTGPVPALLGAALFALHPLQSEAVIWIAARNDLMAAALLLGALAVLGPVEISRRRLVLGGILALGAVLSKESALLVPVFLACLDWAKHGRVRGWRRHAVLWCAVAVHLLARLLAGINAAAAPPEIGWRLLAHKAWHVLATVGALLTWPWPLSVGRDLEGWQLGGPVLVVGLAACLLIPAGLLLASGRRRLVVVGLAWTCMGFAPAVLALADKALFGERYLYLPLAGLGLALAAALDGTGARRTPWRLASLLLTLPWFLIVHHRIPDWKSDLALWAATERDTPSGYVSASHGLVLLRDGQREAALLRFQAAVRARPPHLEICGKLAELALEFGDMRRSVAITRDAAEAGCHDPAFLGQHGVYLAMNGAWGEAEAAARGAAADPQGRGELVLAAAGIVEGDCVRYRALRARWSDPGSLDTQMSRLLNFGGQPALARQVAEGRGCSSAAGPVEP